MVFTTHTHTYMYTPHTPPHTHKHTHIQAQMHTHTSIQLFSIVIQLAKENGMEVFETSALTGQNVSEVS